VANRRLLESDCVAARDFRQQRVETSPDAGHLEMVGFHLVEHVQHHPVVLAVEALAQAREHVDFLVLVVARRGLVEVAADRGRRHLRVLVGAMRGEVLGEPAQQHREALDALVTRQPHLDRLVEAGARRAEIDRACHATPPASHASGCFVSATETMYA
jgi:hypothetical protein